MTDFNQGEAIYQQLLTRIQQARKQESAAVYLIGQCLCELKQQLPGRFQAFLQEANVNLSPRLAQMYMRVARAADGAILAQFGLVNANALLKLAPEQRSKLMEEHDLSRLSVSELRALIAKSSGREVSQQKKKKKMDDRSAAFEKGGDQGFDEGYKQGFTEAFEKGRDRGFDEGHRRGYKDGKKDTEKNYQQGKDADKNYQRGKSEGERKGYQCGYEAGQSATRGKRDIYWAAGVLHLCHDKPFSLEIIHKAFLIMAKIFHPDKHIAPDDENMKLLYKAREILNGGAQKQRRAA